MKLVSWRLRTGGQQTSHTVALFGNGLVGGAIHDALRYQDDFGSTDIPYDWRSGEQRREQRKFLTAEIEVLIEKAPGRPVLDVVWAAGRNGFSATGDEMAVEIALLDEVLDLTQLLAASFPGVGPVFHFISSAGGLFEGQTHVDEASVPAPMRPYAEAKLEQERRVRALNPSIATRIYRPSSVYGYRLGARINLLAALIRGALENRTIRVFGTPHTVRDFLLAEDVGRFVSKQILEPGPGSPVYLLASGKPTSILEMIRLVERILNKPLYLQYDTSPSNARNVSYLPSVLPPGWVVTPLDIGVFTTVRRMTAAFLRHPTIRSAD